jgi:CRP-like cAMP-binding protein
MTDSSFGILRAYLEARAAFSEGEFGVMRTLFRPTSLAAGDFLQRAGDVVKDAAFVARGCLRSYIVDDRGREHIVQFAPETWWLADTTSITTGKPTQYFVDAIEPTDVFLLDAPSHSRLLAEVPGYAASFQAGLQRHAAAKDQRIVNSLSRSAEERYEEFLTDYPSIAARVPQWMVASYLGLSPETLSRVRRSRARK